MFKTWNINVEKQMQISVHFSRDVVRFADMVRSG